MKKKKSVKKLISNNAFTLTELLIVAFIITLIAAFAIPNYRIPIEKAHERKLLTNLYTMHGASMIHRAKYGDYWRPTGLQGTDALNQKFEIDLVYGGGTTYSYQVINPNEIIGTGHFQDSLSNIIIDIEVNDPISDTNPCCRVGGPGECGGVACDVCHMVPAC